MNSNGTPSSRRRFIGRGMKLSAGLLAAPAFPSSPEPRPANETLRTIQSLRSIHGDFSEKPVPDQDVQTILDASVRAANASLTQSYSILVIRDAASLRKLTGYRGGCMFLYCADHTRLLDAAKHLGHTYSPGNIESFITSSTNTILAAQTAVIAAKSLGIDSLLTNGIHRGDMERIWAALDLPQKYCYPLIALILGYPAHEPQEKKGRLRGPGVVHYERYHRLTNDELSGIVRQYDDKTQYLALDDTWTQKGHKHYLDWFYTEWLNEKPLAAETQMMKRLRKSGFVDMQDS